MPGSGRPFPGSGGRWNGSVPEALGGRGGGGGGGGSVPERPEGGPKVFRRYPNRGPEALGAPAELTEALPEEPEGEPRPLRRLPNSSRAPSEDFRGLSESSRGGSGAVPKRAECEFEEESKQPPMTEQQRHQLKHRELFLSRQFESLPATHIRGKCSVTLLNETDILGQYLEKEDCFFYSLVFDPVQKTLLADQGEIRVGCKYQAEIPDRLAEGESDNRNQQKMEMKVWDPDNPLTDRQIDQFLVVARAVGTFARALDCSSSIRQPSLHMSAAAASRDITLFHAMDTLQRNGYDLAKAMSTLVPQGGPVLCRDEMEEWSASEAMLFEEALEKYGKDFNDIRQDFLPWKSLASIVQFYYMWKTTDRYIQQKRLKAAEADSKLKQVLELIDVLQVGRPGEGGRLAIGGGQSGWAGPDGSSTPLSPPPQVGASGVPFSANGRPLAGGLRAGPPPASKRQKLNPADAPNPVVFVATKDTRALRKALTHLELRRAARRPNLPLKVKPGLPLRPGGALAPPAPPHPASTSEPIVLED
uniref:Metastasis associated 1 family member 2 n=1 Tax=Anser brachyrhynchus TaxID=132585 RepID=A0A8B9CVN6_9AVES